MTYEAHNTQSQRKQGGIFMLALALLFTACLQAQNAPVITGVKETNPGVVTIYGSGFGSQAGTVALGGFTFPATSWTDTGIVLPLPSNYVSGSTAVVVTTSTQQTASSVLAIYAATLSSAASDRDNRETIMLVGINGKGNQAAVAAGATFTVSFLYSATCTTDCPLAIQLGLNTGSPQACFYAKQLGSAEETLTAPSEPGIYYILFDRNQNFCNAVWDTGTPPLTQSLGTIFVK